MTISRVGPPIIRSGLPRGGSLAGLQKRREFITSLLLGAPDTRQLFVPLGSDTTSSTSVDSNARALTWDATIASRFTTLGSGLMVSFDGSTNYATSPDAANMSFNGGSPDLPFSIYAVINVTATAAVKTILARYDLTTGTTNLEWRFIADATEKLTFQVFDDSVGTDVRVGRSFNTALPTATNMLVIVTYSGSGTAAGVKLYSFDGTNAGQVDDTDSSAGSYVALEAKAGLTYLGASEGTGGAFALPFSGSMGAVGLVSGELTASGIQIIRQAVNGYYGLAV